METNKVIEVNLVWSNAPLDSIVLWIPLKLMFICVFVVRSLVSPVRMLTNAYHVCRLISTMICSIVVLMNVLTLIIIPHRSVCLVTLLVWLVWMKQHVYRVQWVFILMDSVWVCVRMAPILTTSLKPVNYAMKDARNVLILPQYVRIVFRHTTCS